MTTLSKEVIESVADKYDFSEFSSEFKTSIEELYKFVAELELLVRADLVAENERLKAEISILTETKESVWKALKHTEGTLTAARTALAAAEADNKQLRKALNEILTTDWVSDRVRRTAKAAIAQPRDDSALREMIAGVYEECAKVADLFEQKADALNDSIADDDGANEGRSEYIMGKATASSRIAKAIRALAKTRVVDFLK